MCQDEIWVFIPGFDDRYQVSSYGRVKATAHFVVDTLRRRRCLRERLLSQQKDADGYHRVTLNGKFRGVHQLVLISFGGAVEGKQPNHKDGIKSNNRLDNLEWMTPKENTQHAIEHGLRPLVFGRRPTESTRQKMSASQKRRWQIQKEQ